MGTALHVAKLYDGQIKHKSKYYAYSRRFSGDFSQTQRRHTMYVAFAFAEKDRKDTGIIFYSQYITIQSNDHNKIRGQKQEWI